MKTALITGASRGLGYGFACALAPSYHIIAAARTVGGLEELDDDIKKQSGRATLVPIDLTDVSAISNLCAALFEEYRGIDLWIHTAIHTPPLSPVHSIDAKDFEKTLNATAFMAKNLIINIDPLLRLKNGIAFYMVDETIPQKFSGTYRAGKASEQALFDAWRIENKKRGLKIAPLYPRPTATAVRGRFFPGEDKSELASHHEEAKRLLKEADVIS